MGKGSLKSNLKTANRIRNIILTASTVISLMVDIKDDVLFIAKTRSEEIFGQ